MYYTESSKLHQLSYVIISNYLQHDTVTVYVFQKCLIEFLTDKFNCCPHKIIYFSDGAAAQYKNQKNFLNLCHHKADFGVEAEWHFFATSHGKGTCDGLGSIVKRLAAKASLQRPYEHQMMTPRQLYEWASDNISTVAFNYRTTSTDNYKKAETFLECRFQQSRTIPGTQKFHCFIPFKIDKLYIKVFSNSSTQKEVKVTLFELDELPLEEIKGFVTAVHNSQ